jgi:hypothetical protein
MKRLILVVAVLLAGCAPGALLTTASPSPSPSPTPSPTPEPTPTEAPTPSPSVAVDPAAGLAIASPYSITELDAASAAAIATAMETSLGGFSSVIHVGTRTVEKARAVLAYVMVIEFPTGMMTASTYQAMLAGMAASGKTTFKTTTVSGLQVSTGKMATTFVGVFDIGDHVLMVLAPAAADVIPISKALITANQ